MNRTIKFRGLRVDGKGWVYGDLLLNNGDPIIIRQVDRSYIGTVDVGAGKHWFIETPAYSVIPSTVGQFTGFLSKSRIEIYEGDFLNLSYSRDTTGQDIISFTHEVEWDEKNGFSGWEIPFLESAEVIGNIHEQ
jgi:hypothetical protein